MKLLEVFFLVCLVSSYCRCEQLLHTVDGEVGRGNYTYYSLMYDGPITLFLYSTVGDADLYVSQHIQKPTYDPETYCLQSCTCGLDIVYIAKDFQRPVGIGVYGHPSHESSSYVLEVYDSDHDHNNESLGAQHVDSDYAEPDPESSRKSGSFDYERRESSDHNEDPREESVFWTLLWSFFDIFIEVIFL